MQCCDRPATCAVQLAEFPAGDRQCKGTSEYETPRKAPQATLTGS